MRSDLRLSPEESRRWERDGFFVRERVFSEAELVELREAGEAVVVWAARAAESEGNSYRIDGNRYHEVGGVTVQCEHTPGSRTVRVIEPFHHLHPRFDRLVDDPRIVEPVRVLVGSERVSLFTDKINLKRPREGSRFRWHQDSPYWTHVCNHLDRLPNVMVTLDAAAEENGCFRVVAGSHMRGRLPGLEGQGRLGPLFTDPAYFDASREVLIEVAAGSLVFFSPHVVHGSQPNLSGRKRRALVLTYQPGGYEMFKLPAERAAGRPAA